MGELRWFDRGGIRRPVPNAGGVRLVPLTDLRRLHQLVLAGMAVQVALLLWLGLK